MGFGGCDRQEFDIGPSLTMVVLFYHIWGSRYRGQAAELELCLQCHQCGNPIRAISEMSHI